MQPLVIRLYVKPVKGDQIQMDCVHFGNGLWVGMFHRWWYRRHGCNDNFTKLHGCTHFQLNYYLVFCYHAVPFDLIRRNFYLSNNIYNMSKETLSDWDSKGDQHFEEYNHTGLIIILRTEHSYNHVMYNHLIVMYTYFDSILTLQRVKEYSVSTVTCVSADKCSWLIDILPSVSL